MFVKNWGGNTFLRNIYKFVFEECQEKHIITICPNNWINNEMKGGVCNSCLYE